MHGTIKYFGNYSERQMDEEHMTLQFKAATLGRDELWENGTLSASFLSKYWGNFFPECDRASRAGIEDSVRYIAGELIGNAVKFSCEPDFLVRIALCLSDYELHFFVTNSLEPEDAEEYQHLIQQLLGRDPEEMYLEQMERTARNGRGNSRIGFLTIMLIYGATLAWKFERNMDTDIITSTSMVRMPVVRHLKPESRVG